MLLVCLWLGGCSGPSAPGGRFGVAPGGYAEAFDACRRTLTDMGFRLDRVDAAAGVITTMGRRGLGAGAGTADLFHAQSRSVRIEFIEADRFGRMPSDSARTQIDEAARPRVLEAGASLVGTVTALRHRTYRPGLRPQTVDALRSGRFADPSLTARDMLPSFEVPIARDPALEDEVAGRVVRSLADQSSDG
jgi:hypothetical protein